MMDLPVQFNSSWQQQFPHIPVAGARLLLAVSGGMDSVVLTDLLHRNGHLLVLAHGNFQLRGAESERDEQFVRTLAETYQVPLLVKKFDTTAYAEARKLSIQEAARELRYNWFKEIINGGADAAATIFEKGNNSRQSPAYIVTAHHANDNIETLLINFFRGTGISGLHGILPLQGNVLRPLLFAKRADIKEYAIQQNLRWVEDSSNASDKYVRNHFRLNLIPGLQQVFPNVEQNLLQNIQRFRDIEILYNQALERHTRKLLTVKGNEVHIPVLRLQQLQPLHTLLWEITRPYGFTAAQVTEIAKLLQAESGSYVASATHRIIRNRNWLIVAPKAAETAANILIEAHDTTIRFAAGTLRITHTANTPGIISQHAHTACLDAADIRFPLLLRRWKQGDYFYPLGMRKKKKVSRFLIDQKLSATAKEKVWVIESNRKIIWVAGLRIDDRFKLTPASQKVVKIVFEAKD